MKKLLYRSIILSLCMLLAVDSALAGRWLRGCLRSLDPCAEVCCKPVCCEPAPCCECPCECSSPAPCEAADPCAMDAPCDNCDEPIEAPVSESCESCDASAERTPEPMMESDPAPTAHETFSMPAPVLSADEPVELSEPEEEFLPAPTVLESTSEATEVVDDPMPAVEPVEEDLFADDTADDMVDEEPVFIEEQPAVEEPLFDDEPAMAREEESAAEDLFADEPATDDNDMFFADEIEPVEEVAQPAEEADDLFGDTGFDDQPAEMEEPAEVQEAAAEPDDFFFDDQPEEEPVEQMVDEQPTEDNDLFGGDLFGDEPAEEAATEAESATEDEGDLFGDQPEAPAEDDFGFDAFDEEPAEEAPVEEPADEADDEDDLDEDDLFGGFGAILREPGGYDSVATRSWVDNSGQFSCMGRLVDLDGSSIKLLKMNGKMATVPLARLSQRDLEFVNRQVLAQQEVDTPLVAQR